MTRTTLQQLLKYPHAAVFDGAPAAELAFCLRHPDRAVWTVAERVLTAKAGLVPHVYDLRALTLRQLVLALRADGFEVTREAAQYSHLSAMVLIEASGDEYTSNGDAVFAFTSLLWVIMSAYAEETIEAQGQVLQALRQMVIKTAGGEWLDLWGKLYGVPRKAGDSDALYSPKIEREAFRLRNNAHAIELAILDETGFDVRIIEPWKSIFWLSGSKLSGPDRFYDGGRTGYHLIEPVMTTVVDWPAVLRVINRNRAAGVEVLGPRLIYGSWLNLSVEPFPVLSGVLMDSFSASRWQDKAPLDGGPLEEVAIRNYASLRLNEIMHVSGSSFSVQPWGGFTWAAAGAWSDTTYLVTSAYQQDYEIYYATLEYRGQLWDATQRTWSGPAATSWSDFNIAVISAHSEES